MATKVLYVRLPANLHDELVLLAQHEECTLQKLGLAAVIQLLDVAYQQGRLGDVEGTPQEEVQSEQANSVQGVQ